MASASVCDVLATASGIPTVPAHRMYQVSGSAAALTAMLLPLDSPSVEFGEIYDDVVYLASNGEPGVNCSNIKCEQDNRARSLVCRGCKRLYGPSVVVH